MSIFFKATAIFLFALQACLFGQNTSDSAYISFKSTINDFDLVYEADGNFIQNFEFKNEGRKALKINKIIAPGLTIEKISDDSVIFGQSSVLSFKISPVGLAGNYNKKILVFSNASNSPTELLIKGKITSGSNKNNFKYTIGPIDFRQSQINFGYLFKGEEAVRYSPVVNHSEKPVLLKFDSVPRFINLVPSVDTLMPGQISTIEVRFKTSSCNDWDFFIQKIKVIAYSSDTISAFLTISANIREDFTLLNEDEKLKKPEINIPIKIFNFDTISSGKKVFYDFFVYNNGQRDLIIRAVKPTCGCTAAMPDKTIINPGDSTFIRVEFNSDGFTGINKKGVTVITNDPENYKQFLWVTGFVN